MYNVIKINHASGLESAFDSYLRNKPSDCILYSQDGARIKIHKEVFSQTVLMRNILKSAKEQCCSTLEVICPCSKEILKHVANFLYDGEIQCNDEVEALEILECLCLIFGFPKSLVEIYCNYNRNEIAEVSKINENTLIGCNKAIILPIFKDAPNNDDHVQETREVNHNIIIQNPESVQKETKEENPKNCKISNKGFSNKNSLDMQLLSEHPTGKKLIQISHPYNCEICHKTYSKSNYVKHFLSEHREKFTNYKTLHEKKQVKDAKRRKICEKKLKICEICQKRYVKNKSLKKHKILIHGEENRLRKKCLGKFGCSYCEKFFDHKWILRNHILENHKGKNIIDFEGM